MEDLLARLESLLVRDRHHRLATEDDETALIGQRERVTQRTVAQPKLALVVDAPDIVRSQRLTQSRRLRRNAATLRALHHQARALKDVADRAHGWQLAVEAPLQDGLQLLGAPRRPPP